MKKQLITIGLMAMLIFIGCKAEDQIDSGVEPVSTEAIVLETEAMEEKAIKEIMAETEAYPELKQLIIDTYDIPKDYFATTKYYYNYVDLNSDGVEEIFVVVMGPYTSGSGGSSGMIVYPVGGKLYINQEFTLLQTPIIISDTVTNGAKEILLYRSGGGIEGSYVKLTASDGVYTSVNDGTPIESLEGITGRSIISNDLLEDMENGTFLTLE